MHDVTVDHSAPRSVTSEGPDAGRFFADHYMPVMRLCMRHLHDESDAEDAVQEVFRRAVQQGTELRGDPLPWLITVAKNVCRDELRRRRNGRAALERTAALAPADEAAATEGGDNPERVVVGHLFVRELLGRLTPAERRVVAARVYDDASGVEAAHAFGVSSSTTRVLLARARHKLRHYLEEGKVAFGFVPLLGMRGVHFMRRQVLQRPWSGEASAAMFLPAALLVTMMSGPGGAAVSGGAVAVAPSVLGSGAGAVHDAARAAHLPAVGSMVLVHGVPRSTAVHASGGGFTDRPAPSPLLLTPDVERVAATDVEPSPNYDHDHTVLMLGTFYGVCSSPPCTQLFKSTDGGVTWSYVGAPGLAGSSLILPPSSYGSGTFYTWGAGGLQMTTNNGANFVTVVPPTGGWAVAAPAGSGTDVMLSNQALWQLTSGVAPKEVSPFVGNEESAGAPLTILDQTGRFVTLQPVAEIIGITNQTQLLRCAPSCDSEVALPLASTQIELIPSPHFATDHTILAYGAGSNGGLAVSHDDGQTFSAAYRIGVGVTQLVAAPVGKGTRLIAVTGSGGNSVIQFSDDLGRSWHVSTVDPSLGLGDATRVGVLSSGRLIASMAHRITGQYFGFACSVDGSAWGSCAA